MNIDLKDTRLMSIMSLSKFTFDEVEQYIK